MSLQTGPDDNRTSTTEYAGTFDHPSGHANVTYDHDEAGDLTFDGVYRYRYDAWNRLVEVRNASREEGGSQNVQESSVGTAMAYDGLGRRTVKTVSNSGDLNATLHSLYDAQREIEERNGANLVLRQQVWGLDYVDELVVVSTNLNSQGSGSIVVVERYEYTPYGQRQVYRGSENDRKAYTPYLASTRLGSLGHSLNPFGHQGLKHDEGIGLVYNRATKLHPGLGRFVQRDPLGYVDGMSVYAYYAGMWGYVDPYGLHGSNGRGRGRGHKHPVDIEIPPGAINPREFWLEWSDAQRMKWFDYFRRRYGKHIAESSRRHCVPEELLSAIIANEQVDLDAREQAREEHGFGLSVGPAQITVGTAIREGLWTKEELATFDSLERESSRIRSDGKRVPRRGIPASYWMRRSLLDDATNIDVAARLISRYLSGLCDRSSMLAIGQSFRRSLSAGCEVNDFCCTQGRSCDDSVKMNVPKCLIRAMGGLWNNGLGLVDVHDIPKDSPNGHNNGVWAGQFDDVFSGGI